MTRIDPQMTRRFNDEGGAFQRGGPTIQSENSKPRYDRDMRNVAHVEQFSDQREPGVESREGNMMVGNGYRSVIDLTRDDPEQAMVHSVKEQVMQGPQGIRNDQIGTSTPASAFGAPPPNFDQMRAYHQAQVPHLVQSYDSRDLHTVPTEPTGSSAHQRSVMPPGNFQPSHTHSSHQSGIPRHPSTEAGRNKRSEEKRSGSRNNDVALWRLHPSISKSDMKIKIKRKGSGITDEYHVHRDVLANGARKSQVLEQTIRKNKLSAKNNVLILELSNSTADIFPSLLDFAYGHDSVESVKKKSDAFAMYDLAQHLNMPLFMDEIANWFKKKVKADKVLDFLDQAENFSVSGPLVNVGVEVCASNFDDIGKEMAGQIGANVLLMVLERVWEMNYIFHLKTDYVTDLILECTQEASIDKETFYKLTDKRFLPVLEPKSALKLLIIEDEFNDDDSTHLTCLQRRCVRSLVHNWDFLCDEFESPDSMSEILACLKPHVLAAVLIEKSEFKKKRKNKTNK